MTTYSLWLGKFKDQKSFDAYAEPSRRTTPFEVDFGRIDAMFQWRFFTTRPETNRGVIGGLSYSTAYADVAAAAAKKLGIKDGAANAVIACEDVPENPDWKKVNGKSVRYLGTFEFSKRTSIKPLTPADDAPRRVKHGDWISIWLGRFKTDSELARYLAEKRGPGGSFNSQFGRDFAIESDQDYVFGERSKSRTPAIEELISGWPDSSLYVNQAVTAARKAGCEGVNAAIVVRELKYDDEPPFDTGVTFRSSSAPNPKAPVQFLGSFRCKPSKEKKRGAKR
jgi:hypothetical protein